MSRRVSVVLVALLLTHGAAFATEGGAAVAVVGISPPESVPVARAIWAVRRAVDAHPALSAVPLAARLSAGEAEPVDDPVAGRAALEAGRAAFADLDLELATTRLNEAVEKLSGPEGALDEQVEALSLLAQTRVAAHDEGGGEAAFRRLLALSPDFTLDAAATPPSVLRVLERARAPQGDAAEAVLRIETSPRPAALFVDGEWQGITPRVVRGLTAGAHTLELEADGYRRVSQPVRLPPGRGVALTVPLPVARRAELFARIVDRLPEQLDAEVAGPALRDLRSLLFVEQAVLVRVSGPEGMELEAQLFDLRAGRRVGRAEVRAPEEAALDEAAATLVDALYRGRDAKAPGVVLAEPERPPPAKPGTPWYQRWWFWPAVGVVAASAVAIPILVLSGDDEEGLKRHDGSGAVILQF